MRDDKTPSMVASCSDLMLQSKDRIEQRDGTGPKSDDDEGKGGSRWRQGWRRGNRGGNGNGGSGSERKLLDRLAPEWKPMHVLSVEVENAVLSGCLVYFVNYPSLPDVFGGGAVQSVAARVEGISTGTPNEAPITTGTAAAAAAENDDTHDENDDDETAWMMKQLIAMSSQDKVVLAQAATTASTASNSTTPMTAKEVVEKLALSMGGNVSMNYYSSVTHIVASYNDPKVRFHCNKDRDVIALSWLVRCKRAGVKLPLRPRDYLCMSKDTRQRASERFDESGDGYDSDVEAEDVAALVARHLKVEDVDRRGLARRLSLASGGGVVAREKKAEMDESAERDALVALSAIPSPSPQDFLPLFRAQRAQHGVIDWQRCALHGCTLLVLSFSDPSLSSFIHTHDDATSASTSASSMLFSACSAVDSLETAQQRTAAAERATYALLARLHGARMVTTLTEDVTHIIGILPNITAKRTTTPAAALDAGWDDDSLDITPEMILKCVYENAGGAAAVSLLRRRLVSFPGSKPSSSLASKVLPSSLHLVSIDWLNAFFQAAENRTKQDQMQNQEHPGRAGRHFVEIPHEEEYPLLDVEYSKDIPSSWPWSAYLQGYESNTRLSGGRGGKKRAASSSKSTTPPSSDDYALKKTRARKYADAERERIQPSVLLRNTAGKVRKVDEEKKVAVVNARRRGAATIPKVNEESRVAKEEEDFLKIMFHDDDDDDAGVVKESVMPEEKQQQRAPQRRRGKATQIKRKAAEVAPMNIVAPSAVIETFDVQAPAVSRASNKKLSIKERARMFHESKKKG